jgi:hypothetical protein
MHGPACAGQRPRPVRPPRSALPTPLHNCEAKSGRRITDLQAAAGTCGLAKFGERRSWLMSQFKLGHGDANTVLQMVGKLPADFDHESSRVVATARRPEAGRGTPRGQGGALTS